MTDKATSDALYCAEWLEHFAAGRYVSDIPRVAAISAAQLRRQQIRIEELEAEIAAVGAGGVQALSAAPAGWKLVPVEPTLAMIDAALAVNPAHESVWAAYLAASPTPPALSAAPAVACGYFSFSDECGFDRHATAEAAKDAATEMLADIRRELGGEEWPMDVESVCWGVVVERATEDGTTAGEDGEKYCDYVLNGLSPTPPAEQQAQPGAVYAELPEPYSTVAPAARSVWKEEQMRDFADRTHALRLRCKSEQARLATLWGYVRADATRQQAAPKAAPGEPYKEDLARLVATVDAGSSADYRALQEHRVMRTARAVLSAAPQQEAQEPDRATFGLWYADHIGDDNKPVRDAAWETYRAFAGRTPQPAPAPLSEREEIAMIDAAMVEMANIVPPLKRSECVRLIRAALAAQGGTP